MNNFYKLKLESLAAPNAKKLKIALNDLYD